MPESAGLLITHPGFAEAVARSAVPGSALHGLTLVTDPACPRDQVYDVPMALLPVYEALRRVGLGPAAAAQQASWGGAGLLA